MKLADKLAAYNANREAEAEKAEAAEQEAAYAKARIAAYSKQITYMKPLHDALLAFQAREYSNSPVTITLKTEPSAQGPVLAVDGVEVDWFISAQEEYSRDRWHGKSTGRVFYRVGDYGDRTIFKVRKDGSVRWDDMAALVYRLARKRAAERRASAQSNANTGVVKTFREKNFKYGGYDFTTSSSPEKPIFVKVEIKKAMTETEAQELLDLLRAKGWYSRD